jgi:1-acyl-sn-glycerol-3-phosphate acyltransferase
MHGLKKIVQIWSARLIVSWISRGMRHIRIDRRGMKGIKPPYIVLANHTSNFDPALVQVTVGSDVCRFMTSNYYFRVPLIGYVLRKWGAIAKIQFSPDIRAMRGALQVLANGGVVGIFPEGRRSVDGSMCSISLSLVRFLQKAQVQVVAVNIRGGVFLWPRWAGKWRPAKLEVSVNRLFSPAELKAANPPELFDKIRKALDYDDYHWQENLQTKLISKPSVEGLHKILHQCPRCLALRVMQSKQNRLYCSACFNSAQMNEFGALEPTDSQSVVFADPVQWNAWQRRQLEEQIELGQAEFSATVSELRVADKYRGGYRSCGSGELNLQPMGLSFRGQIDGKAAELLFSLANVPAVSTEFGLDFEICDETNAWWFFLQEAQQTIILDTLISLFHERVSRENS